MDCNGNIKLSLASGVFPTIVRDKVFVRDVRTQRNFLFEGSAYDVFEELRTPATAKELANRLLERFEVEDKVAFTRSISDFVELLHGEGLLVSASHPAHPVATQEPIENTVREMCIADNRLWSICLELTYRCNERCVHCYLDRPEEIRHETELSAAEWIGVIDSCHELGCAHVLVTGGEPTLHPGFLGICRHIVEHGLLLDIYTNGLNIPDNVFFALSDLPVNSVSVSLYGLSEFHDSITGVRGSFDKTLSSAMKFKCAGKDVFIKTPLFTGHLDDFFALQNLCQRLGMNVSPSIVMVNGHSGADMSTFMLSEDEFRRLNMGFDYNGEVHGEAIAERIEAPSGRDVDGPVCSAGLTSLSFDPHGDVFACNTIHIPLGNVRDAAVRKIWEESPALARIRRIRFRNLSPSCARCADSAFCTVCLGTAISQNGGSVSRPPYACQYARIRAETQTSSHFARECGH